MISAPVKISRIIGGIRPDSKNGKALKMMIQLDGDSTTYNVLQEQSVQVKESCSR